jgi:hypothetical protein
MGPEEAAKGSKRSIGEFLVHPFNQKLQMISVCGFG